MPSYLKKKMAKHYVKKRKFYFIAFAIALISVIIMVVALILDELSSLGDVSCGALEGSLGVPYADCAELSEDCEKAQIAGIMWIVFACLGIICCFIAPALLGVKKSLSFIPYIGSVLFYILAVIIWNADNPACVNDATELGISCILAIIAAVFALIALILAAYPKCKK